MDDIRFLSIAIFLIQYGALFPSTQAWRHVVFGILGKNFRMVTGWASKNNETPNKMDLSQQ